MQARSSSICAKWHFLAYFWEPSRTLSRMQPQLNLSMWGASCEPNLVSSRGKQGAQMPKVRVVWFGGPHPHGSGGSRWPRIKEPFKQAIDFIYQL